MQHYVLKRNAIKYNASASDISLSVESRPNLKVMRQSPVVMPTNASPITRHRILPTRAANLPFNLGVPGRLALEWADFDSDMSFFPSFLGDTDCGVGRGSF